MKILSYVALILAGVVGALTTFLSIAGFWGGGLMIVAALIAILCWGTFTTLVVFGLLKVGGDDGPRWTDRLMLTWGILSIGSAWALGFGAFATCGGPLWLAPLYHWLGLVGSVLGFVAYFFLPVAASALGSSYTSSNSWNGWTGPICCFSITYGLWGIAWLIIFLLLHGGVDEASYPSTATSPFKLPFPAGEDAWVIQGNNSNLNHNDAQKFAFDFRRQCGTPVLAARDGTVATVVQSNDGYAGTADNNKITITHSDGTVASYLHFEKNSAAVSVGQAVKQGQKLAKVGNVGNSLTGHIHFQVARGANTIPITFHDVSDDHGIPRTFGTYTSSNR